MVRNVSGLTDLTSQFARSFEALSAGGGVKSLQSSRFRPVGSLAANTAKKNRVGSKIPNKLSALENTDVPLSADIAFKLGDCRSSIPYDSTFN